MVPHCPIFQEQVRWSVSFASYPPFRLYLASIFHLSCSLLLAHSNFNFELIKILFLIYFNLEIALKWRVGFEALQNLLLQFNKKAQVVRADTFDDLACNRTKNRFMSRTFKMRDNRISNHVMRFNS